MLARYSRGKKIVTVVPLHPELKPGTLLGVLELARISREDFIKASKTTPKPSPTRQTIQAQRQQTRRYNAQPKGFQLMDS